MGSYLVYGIILGLSAGVSPGPLLALVIRQTLQHNTREGLRVAAVPLITDAPIIGLALFLYTRLSDLDMLLGIVSFAGAAFVAYLGIESLRQQPIEVDLSPEPPRSYFKGALTNLLSPHPYLFWFTIGIPTVLNAYKESVWAAVGFVALIYICLVGSKIIIALLVGRSRDFLSGPVYLWTIRGLGVLLIGFALLLLYEGLEFAGVVSG